MDELVYRIAFASLRLRPDDARRVLSIAGTERRVLEHGLASPEVRRVPRGLQSAAARAQLVEQARGELEFIRRHNVRAVYFTDPDYPQRLLECEDAPLMLYVVGECDLNHSRVVSIVGTRHATAYGTRMVEQIVQDLAASLADPLVVVSGLAFGIDVAAHRAALGAHVPTVAVMARGLDTVYPPEHRGVARDIAQGGGMAMTDYRTCDGVYKGNFLARNRIIAGLADCVVVGESSERGGALNTARLALDYGREVFAVPGRATDKYSQGCNNLILNQRAQMVTCGHDIVRAMNWPEKPREGTQLELPVELPPLHAAILKILEQRGDTTQFELAEILNLPQPQLASTLIDMEFASLITPLPGGRYRLG